MPSPPALVDAAHRAAEWRRPVAGVTLALLSAVEAVVRVADPGADLPLALLLGVSATLPLAFERGHPAAVAAAITVAGCLTMVFYRGVAGAPLAALLVVWWLAARRRLRARRALAAERDASRRAVETTLLELTARGERARIARELHDVVAHHISMISVQAETARLATPGMPEEGAKRLLAIGDTARTALTEMRRLLGVLREDASAEPTRRPQPGLAQLLELVDESRNAAGGQARLIVRGPVTPLDPGVEIAAYRIVQEALTNARRHAPAAAVDVELEYRPDALALRVLDNGPGPPPPGPEGHGPGGGHGLLGMRERVGTVGGELRAGPAPLGGFLVEALLPTARPDDTQGATR
ncbi:histidine kinase [Streptomyces sp. B6B3]|uniref:sensor histidine kinase n=1 Tax=Streptomyces sp. B6B3 TaxID=3153570 RepID=UPI00325EC2FB